MTQTLLVIAGPPLHGKTRLGKEFSAVSGFVHFDVDDMRAKHFPHIVNEGGVRDKSGEFFLAGDAEVTTVCYQLAMAEVAGLIAQGKSVVFTGTHSKDAMKAPVLRWMRDKPQVRCVVVKIVGQLSEETASRRIATRLAEGSHSPIVDPSVYLKTLDLQTPWPTDEDFNYHEVEVGPSVEDMVAKVRALLDK